MRLASRIVGSQRCSNRLSAGNGQHRLQGVLLGPNLETLDPEQWRVTAEADAVIAEFASLYKQEGNGGYVLLSGHDQRVGSEQNAMLRSQRRADAVRDVLIEHGVPARVISTKACGWSRLMVLTEHGVQEPQNRYVLFGGRATKLIWPRSRRTHASPEAVRDGARCAGPEDIAVRPYKNGVGATSIQRRAEFRGERLQRGAVEDSMRARNGFLRPAMSVARRAISQAPRPKTSSRYAPPILSCGKIAPVRGAPA